MHKNNNPSLPYFFTQESAQYYECSFCCDNAIVLVNDGCKFFITDGRYETEARQYSNAQTQVRSAHQWNLIGELISLLKSEKIEKVLFDPLHIVVSDFERLQRELREVEFVPYPNFHQEFRKIKTPEEIKKLQSSQKLNRQAFREFGEFLKEGVGKSEKELQFMAKGFFTLKGEYPLSFEPIFALNKNTAKPYALPESTSILQKGDWVLLDCGLKFEHYCSDMTRCGMWDEGVDFFSPKIPKGHQKIYDLVRKAQEYAIEHLREGMQAKEVDALARGVIEEGGYGKYFVHSTGHGVGLDIHELPIISPRSEEIIGEGMVFSVEPGIYLPNEMGIRIEDLVVIKNGRAQRL